MNYIIGCDAHKHFSQFAIFEEESNQLKQISMEHQPGEVQELLSKFHEGTPVAVESIGNFNWIMNEIETVCCKPLMAHAAKAMVMVGNMNKSDKLDAHGLASLLCNGTLPTIWISPAEIRDECELPRNRKVLCKIRISIKNRIPATLAKYMLSIEGVEDSSDIFAKGLSSRPEQELKALPAETQKCVHQELELNEALQTQIDVM